MVHGDLRDRRPDAGRPAHARTVLIAHHKFAHDAHVDVRQLAPRDRRQGGLRPLAFGPEVVRGGRIARDDPAGQPVHGPRVRAPMRRALRIRQGRRRAQGELREAARALESGEDRGPGDGRVPVRHDVAGRVPHSDLREVALQGHLGGRGPRGVSAHLRRQGFRAVLCPDLRGRPLVRSHASGPSQGCERTRHAPSPPRGHGRGGCRGAGL